jgi:succinylglutamate desuccinylase
VTAVSAPERTFERFLGRLRGSAAGPTAILSGGVHGNEPAGALAAERVLTHLHATDAAIRGEILAVAGNLEALSVDRRYVHQDLNRAWTTEKIDALLAADPALDDSEQREQRELLHIFEEHRRTARGPVVILDLHTTSAGGPPFCLFSDTLENRRIAMQLGVPSVLGLEECIDGTLLDYATKGGMNAFVVEGGQHTQPESVDYHEAAIWLTLLAIEVVVPEQVPDLARHRRVLHDATAGLPRVLEVRYRHAVAPDDAFVMKPGYVGFQPIAADEVLAHDRGGPIRSRETGRVLMPLYQEQGEDGFFVIRRIHGFWMGVSTAARRMGLPGLIPLLPGVRHHPDRPDWVIARRRVARFYRTQVFHLLGFRTREETADEIVFARRRRKPS